MIRKTPQGVVFKINVQPRSSKNMIVGLQGDALKIKLTSPPVDNAANRMCVQFLAKRLGVAKSSIEIVAGHTSRKKQVLLRSDQVALSESEQNHLKRLIEKLACDKAG